MGINELCLLKKGRLEHYKRKAADKAYWGDHWEQGFSTSKYKGYDKGNLGQYSEVFDRIFSKQGTILEAGCGLGQIVLALNKRGFTCEGVEYSAKTVEMVKQSLPDLPIRVGDVTCLEVPEGTYSGLLSLGVIEHRKEGPMPFLDEAFRVLQQGGVAFISVPYFNSLRRLKGKLGCYQQHSTDEHEFYQYILGKKELSEYIQQAGFVIEGWHNYGGWKGLKDELPFVRQRNEAGNVSPKLRNKLNRNLLVRTCCGHMIGAICRKPEKR